jgi:hypothetical protein
MMTLHLQIQRKILIPLFESKFLDNSILSTKLVLYISDRLGQTSMGIFRDRLVKEIMDKINYRVYL